MYYLYTTKKIDGNTVGYELLGTFNTYDEAREAGAKCRPMIISTKELT